MRTKADPEGRRSLTELKGWRDKEQLKGPEVRGAGRVMTDQGIAGGTRKGGAKAEPTAQWAEVEQWARRPEWEPGDHHNKVELEIRKPKADPSSWAEPPKEEPKG